MTIKEVVLSINDVENALDAFERKYRVPSNQFLVDQKLRETMSEDEIFQWESYIDHRNELLDMNREMHHEYLHQVTLVGDDTVNPKEKQLALAA